MNLRTFVYRRDLSNNPQSPFRSNGKILRKAACCISGFLGLLFLGLALWCLFYPNIDKDGKLFIIFMNLFGVFEIICFIYSCIFVCQKCFGGSSRNEAQVESSRTSLLPSTESRYQEIPDYHGVANYQACSGFSESDSFEADASCEEFPSYLPSSYNVKGGYLPGLHYLYSPINYAGVFAHQQIPIYQQDLVEPQLPPYSSKYVQSDTSP